MRQLTLKFLFNFRLAASIFLSLDKIFVFRQILYMESGDVSLDIRSYSRRWVILLGVGLITLMLTFNNMAFGLVNNITVAYYRVSYEEADWIVLTCSVGSLLAAPVLAYFVFNDTLGLRKLVISGSGLLLVNYIFILLSFFQPKLFALILLGQGIGGISKAIMSSVPPAFAVLWFPENQIGLAIGLSNIGISAGSFLAYLLLPNILKNPDDFLNLTNNGSNPNKLSQRVIMDQTPPLVSWFSRDEIVFGIVFFIFAGLTLIILVFSYFGLTDLPPHPPSIAQYLERHKGTTKEDRGCKKFALATKKLFSNILFILHGIAFGIVYYSILLEDTMIQQIIRSILPTQTKQKAGVISSHVMAFYSVGSTIGNIVSGKLLDRFKHYTLQASSGAAFSFVFCLLVLLGCYLRNLVVICFGMALLGFSSRISMIPLVDSILQHNYPLNPLFLTNWLGLLRNLQGIAIVQAGRFLYNHYGAAAVLILQAAIIFFSFLLSVCIKPELNRFKAEDQQEKEKLKNLEKQILIKRN